MARVLTPLKPNNRHERFVEDQLRRAARRIRQLDLLQGGLGLGVIVLGYGLTMMLADRWLHLPSWLRQAGFAGMFFVVGVYGWMVLLRPLRRRVNPYYTAVQVEQTIPNAKNSVVNWLDLHDDEVAPSIKALLGQRAAEDLKSADLEQAIQSRRSLGLGLGLLALVGGFLACLLLFRGDQFQSLLVRVFRPFGGDAPILKQTRVTLVEPAEGNVMVATHRSVRFIVHLEGRIPPPGRPDSARLMLRYSTDEPFESLPLQPMPDAKEEWGLVLPPKKVRTGFWYKISAGDDETPEFRVQVRASPAIERFDVLHIYRPYLRWEPRRTDNPNIEDYRGTQMTLDAVTNRRLIEGKMVLESEGQHRSINGQIPPEQPDTIRFQFVLESDAKYRLFFTTTEGESNPDSLPYQLRVLSDEKPIVQFTKPEPLTQKEPATDADLVLPADGMLRLEGVAQDDFGITGMTLNMVLDGRELSPKPYLTAQDFKLETGGLMRSVKYKDDVDFLELKSSTGLKVQPRAGQILEFWLEAKDNCDYPAPQKGQTPKYRVRIAPPRVNDQQPPRNDTERQAEQAKRQERDQERQRAAEEKREHDQKHQQDRQQQSEKDKREHFERQASAKNGERRQQQPQQPSENENPNNNPTDDRSAERPQDMKDDPKAPTGPANEGNEQNKEATGDSTEDKIEKIKRELAKEQPETDPRSENKPDVDRSPAGGTNPTRSDDADIEPMNKEAAPGQAGKNSPGDTDSSQPSSQRQGQGQANRGGDSSSDASSPKAPERSSDQDSKGARGESPSKSKSDDREPNSMAGSGSQDETSAPRPEGRSPHGRPKNEENQSKNSDAPNESSSQAGAMRDRDNRSQSSKNARDTDAPSVPDQKPRASTAEGQTTGKHEAQESGQSANSVGQRSARAENKPITDTSADHSRQGDPMPSAPKPVDGNHDSSSSATAKSSSNDTSRRDGPSTSEAKSDGFGDSPKSPTSGQHQPSQEEMERWAEQMKSSDATKRQAARERLAKMAGSAADPEKRRAAQALLDEAEKNSGQPDEAKGNAKQPKDKNASNKPTQPGQSTDSAPPEAKQTKEGGGEAKQPNDEVGTGAQPRPHQEGMSEPKSGQGKAAASTAKSSNESAGSQEKDQPSGGASEKKSSERAERAANDASDQGQGAPSDSSRGQPSGSDPPEKKPANASSSSPDKGSGDQSAASAATKQPTANSAANQTAGQAGSNPADGTDLTSRAGGSSSTSPLMPQPEERNEEFARRSGDLNLEKVDPKKLRELFQKYNLTDQEYQKWLAQQKEREQRTTRSAKTGDYRAADRSKGGLNSGIRRIERPQDAQDGKLSVGNTGQAPPEYRKAAERFAELLSKPPEPKSK